MLPMLFCFFIFCFWLRYELRKSSSKTEKDKNILFENESRANSTRKKSINSLNYITISEKSILFIEINDDTIIKIQKNFVNLKDMKILNLSSMTNTELKSEYGPGNLTALTEYDNNYTELIRQLHLYAKRLDELEYFDESIEVLEYSVSIGCDMITSYRLLADLYNRTNNSGKISSLAESARQITSITREPILELLHSSIS